MSEALAVIDAIPLPKGVTKRQMRLAALLPRCETAAEALRLAGYSEVTIRNNGYRQVALGGVKRASEAIANSQLDKARGLMGLADAALADRSALLEQLDARDRIQTGLAAIKLAHEIGETVQQVGDGETWRARLRRGLRLAMHLGYVAGRRTQDVVLSPTHNSSATANQQNE